MFIYIYIIISLLCLLSLLLLLFSYYIYILSYYIYVYSITTSDFIDYMMNDIGASIVMGVPQ